MEAQTSGWGRQGFLCSFLPVLPLQWHLNTCDSVLYTDLISLQLFVAAAFVAVQGALKI